MLDGENDIFDRRSGDGEGALNNRECPHCALWFHLDDADIKPNGNNKFKCPNCGWDIQQEKALGP